MNVHYFNLFMQYYHKNTKSVLIYKRVLIQLITFGLLFYWPWGGGFPHEGEVLVDAKPGKFGTETYDN